MTIYTWSITADENANSDSAINWAEFQDPDTVNNSARAMMGRISEFRDDLLPTRVTTGTNNAYLVTAVAAPLSFSADFVVWFRADRTNSGSATLKVNALATKPLRAKTGTALAPGEIQAGTVVGAYYSLASDEFLIVNSGFHANAILPNVVSAYAVGLKAGTIVDWAGPTLPAGYLWCDGSAVSRSTYAELFTNIGTTYGNGNGSTTFNLPDAKGRGTFGRDNMGSGGAAGRITNALSGIQGNTLGASGGEQATHIARNNLPNVNMAGTTNSYSHTHFTVSNSSINTSNPSLSGPAVVISRENTNSLNARYALGGNTTLTPNRGLSSEDDHSHTVTVNLNGNVTQIAYNKMPPALIVNKIILALPAAANAAALGTNGVPYTFDDGTADADPGAGKLRLNNADPTAATEMYVSETGANSEPFGPYLDTWDDALSTVKGRLHFYKIGAVGTFAIYSLTGTVTDKGDYRSLTISHITSNGSFAAGDQISVLFYANGGDQVPTYAVADLPTSGPNIAIASDGRKNGEGAGNGTGVLCFRISTTWYAADTGAEVEA